MQVVAERQPADVFRGLYGGKYTQEQCHSDLKCYQYHRDRDLAVQPGKREGKRRGASLGLVDRPLPLGCMHFA